MPRVDGPLFSLAASGQLGNSIVYGSWKGRPTVRTYKKPANPNTITQQGQRAAGGGVSKLWANLTQPEKDSWDTLAAQDNVSGFNAFQKKNLNFFGAGTGKLEAADPPNDPQASIDDVSAPSIVENGNINTLSVDLDTVTAENFAIAFLRVAQGAPGPTAMNKNNLIGIVYAASNASFTFDHDDAGVAYDYYAIALGRSGQTGLVMAMQA